MDRLKIILGIAVLAIIITGTISGICNISSAYYKEYTNEVKSKFYMDSCSTFDKGKMVGRSAMMLYISKGYTKENPLNIEILDELKVEDSIAKLK